MQPWWLPRFMTGEPMIAVTDARRCSLGRQPRVPPPGATHAIPMRRPAALADVDRAPDAALPVQEAWMILERGAIGESQFDVIRAQPGG